MYVIIVNNQVVDGPKPWKPRQFQNTLLEEFEIEYQVPQTPTTIITDSFSILPAQLIQPTEYDQSIQVPHGPFWSVTDNVAIGTYTIENMPIDSARNFKLAKLSDIRYNNEIGGKKTTINGVEVTLDTSRESRGLYLQTLQLGLDNQLWKFPEAWVPLSYTDLQQVARTVTEHVQACFNWEASKISELNSANTLEEISAVSLDYVI